MMLGERYTLGEKLGDGGMGTVYRGVDTDTGEPVAIKVLKSELAQGALLERFVREGEALRQLNHPNIVKLLDTILTPERNALVLELVSGGSLGAMIHQQERLSIRHILEIALDLADALTRAHRLNIIHRDIKPDNVLMAEDGRPLLTDFGVASVSGSSITEAGMLVGTVCYLSPEQLQGQEATTLSDIWSFGVTMFEMLAGEKPFPHDQFYNTLNAIVNNPVPDLEALRPDAPVELIDLVYRMLAKNPAERIPSIRLVGAEIEALLHRDDEPVSLVAVPGESLPKSTFSTTPAAASAHTHNLPHQTTPFVGRETELHSLYRLLIDPAVRLVTIVAPGGMGKTRLSIEVAKRQLSHFPQGIYFVELAPLDSAEWIPATVAETVGYPFQTWGGSSQQQMVDYFREKAQLLVLDNFEHVIEGRSFVQMILQGAPHVKVLVTSRERLNLSGETVFQLEGMGYTDWETPEEALQSASVRLFMDSAHRVRPDYVLSADDLPHVRRICQLVEGLPLALVLAGTWLEMLSVREIADEIAQDIDFLETTLHDVPERQRSMRAVFEYSWLLLTDDEQAMFARMAVFRGGLIREAAQAVTGANLRALQTLTNKSMLRRDNVTGRYEIHEQLRQYAHEHLREAGELAGAQHQHAAYFAEFLRQRDADVKGRRQLPALHEIDADFENIKTAWHSACDQRDSAIISAMLETLYWYGNFRSRSAEVSDLFRQARQVWVAENSASPLLAGQLHGRFPEAVSDYGPVYELALSIAEHHADPGEIAFCKRQLGHWHSHSKLNNDTGIPLLKESAAYYRQAGDKFYEAVLLDDLGWSYNLSANRAEHLAHVERSLALRREIGDTIGVANSQRNLGGAHGGFGAGTAQPMHDWQEALALAREIGDRSSIAWNNAMLSAYWLFEGECEQAVPFREEALKIATEINNTQVRGICLLLQALDIILAKEDYDAAERLCLEGYPPNSPSDLRLVLWHTTGLFMAFARGDFETISEAIRFLSQDGYRWQDFMAMMRVLAAVTHRAADGDYEQAAEYLGIIQDSSTPLYKQIRYWGWFVRLGDAIEQALGTERFQQALARGKAHDLFAISREVYPV